MVGAGWTAKHSPADGHLYVDVVRSSVGCAAANRHVLHPDVGELVLHFDVDAVRMLAAAAYGWARSGSSPTRP
jgi:hypothetical protein